jgi:integrase
MSREIDTEKEYFMRATSLIKKAYKEAVDQKHKATQSMSAYKDINNTQFLGLSLFNTCIWFKNFWASNLRPRTLRLYRASLVYYIEIELADKKIDQVVFDKMITVLSSMKAGDAKDLELRTSAKKQKHLTVKDYKVLDDALKESKNKWSAATRIWLKSGIITGLRPVEWRQSVYDEEENRLIIKNAKNTNGRSHGEFRSFYFDHLTASEKNILLQHLKVSFSFSQTDEIWKQYYEGCSNLLKYTSGKLWPSRERHPTLYSARHQFSANMKASGCKPEEIATLMGHAVDDTALTTYGKKANGTRNVKPKINEEEIKRVKRTTSSHKFKIDDLVKKKSKGMKKK